MKKYLTVLCTFALVIFGCKKSIDKKYSNDNQNLIFDEIKSGPGGGPNSETDWAATANSLIPDDTVGYLHNLGVKFVFDQLGVPLPGKPEAYESAMAYTNSKFGSTIEQYVRSNYPLTTINSILADSTNNFGTVISNASLTNYSKAKLRILVTALKDTTHPDAAEYAHIKDVITQWEAGVQADQNIPSNEKTILFRVSSIARYSSLYWHNEFSALNPGVDPVHKKRKWWQWLIVGLCDAGGAVAGSFVNPGVAVSAGAAASVGAATIINWGSSE